jgi:hypothetical protein
MRVTVDGPARAARGGHEADHGGAPGQVVGWFTTPAERAEHS